MINFKKTTQILTLLAPSVIVFLFVLFPHFVFSQENVVLLSGSDGILGFEGGYQTGNLDTFLNNIFTFGIGIAAVLSVIMIVLGGISWMLTDAPGVKTNAKERIGNAIWGLILAIASYLILFTINPQLVSFNLFN